MSTVVATRLDSRHRRRWRSFALWVTIIAVITTVSTIAVWPHGSTFDLDPDNPGRRGTRALARVLTRQGISIKPVRSAGALRRSAQDPLRPRTLAVNGADSLSDSAIDTVSSVAGSFDYLVLIGVDAKQLNRLGLPVKHSSESSTRYGANCSDPIVGKAQWIHVQRGYWIEHDSDSLDGCFGSLNYHLLVYRPARNGMPRIDAVADTKVFTNKGITEDDNAVLALRLLSRTPNLVWYSPGITDAATVTSSSEPDLLPPWANQAMLLLLFVGIAIMIWRGRRYGPLVREPLPVTVPAIETVQSRGYLYQRHLSPHQAFGILQEATRRRLRNRLAVPDDAPPRTLITAVAQASGRHPRDVGPLLFETPPSPQHQLVAWAQSLSQLEQEIR